MRTGSSSLDLFEAVISQPPKHVTQVAEGSYHHQLIRSDLDFTLWPAVNRAAFPMHGAHL